MRGRPPKRPDLRRGHHRRTSTRLPPEAPFKRPPPLPKREGGWSEATKRWWVAIWTSPMAEEFVRVDIHGLVLLAELREKFTAKPTASMAAEIRLQAACFGLDPISRRRLGWTPSRSSAKDSPMPARKLARTRRRDPRHVLDFRKPDEGA